MQMRQLLHFLQGHCTAILMRFITAMENITE